MEIFYNSEKSLNVDEIITLTNLDPATINQNLTFLELKNLIQQNANKYILRRQKIGYGQNKNSKRKNK